MKAAEMSFDVCVSNERRGNVLSIRTKINWTVTSSVGVYEVGESSWCGGEAFVEKQALKGVHLKCNFMFNLVKPVSSQIVSLYVNNKRSWSDSWAVRSKSSWNVMMC